MFALALSFQIGGVVTESTLMVAHSQYRLFFTEMLKCESNWRAGRQIAQGK
jgi:hypothetical protein